MRIWNRSIYIRLSNVYTDMYKSEISGKEKLTEFIQERLINGKVGFLDKEKIISRLELKQKKIQKIKLFQLFKRIAKHLDLSLTYSWTLRKLFHFLLPLYLYVLLIESWDSQGQERRLFEIISLKNQ